MDEFSAEWLAEREVVDQSARSSRLAHAIGRRMRGVPDLKVLDLATGTGSNARYLAGHLPPLQHWLLVDRDPQLLEHVPERMASWAAGRGLHMSRDGDGIELHDRSSTYRFETRRRDLHAMNATDLFAGRALVTASALLDLVSDRWLRWLADECRRSEATVLFALTYDGRIRCSPEDPNDEAVRELVNRHQRIHKGFGPAVGPDGTDRAEECFARLGYRVRREPSDWVLPPDARRLQGQLIAGWAEAARAMAPARATLIAGWRARRLAHVEEERSRIIVGHADLAAWLP